MNNNVFTLRFRTRNFTLILLALTLVCSGLLIYVGETDQTLWASTATRGGKPSLEIRP